MKYCEAYAALLDLYVDGELAPEDMIQVQEHLTNCPGCQSYVDDALAMRAAFPDVEETVVPHGFAEGVIAAIQASAAPVKKKRSAPWIKVIAPLAACCAIVVLLQSGPMNVKKESAAPGAAYDMVSQSKAVSEEAAEECIAETAVAQTENDTAGGQAAKTMPETERLQDGVDAELISSEPMAAQPEMPAEMIDAVYLSAVYLPAECAPLLAEYEAILETEHEFRYELTMAQWETLSAQLEESSFIYSIEGGISPTTDLVLVTLPR